MAATEVGTAMRVNPAISGTLLPGLIAGAIYFVIAFATGASVAASIIGGVVVAVIAMGIGFALRAVFAYRASRRT